MSSLAGSFRNELANEGIEVTHDTYNGSQVFFTANHAITFLQRVLPQHKPELRLLVESEDIRLKEAHEHVWATFDALKQTHHMPLSTLSDVRAKVVDARSCEL